jgi:hypothetical protein
MNRDAVRRVLFLTPAVERLTHQRRLKNIQQNQI